MRPNKHKAAQRAQMEEQEQVPFYGVYVSHFANWMNAWKVKLFIDTDDEELRRCIRRRLLKQTGVFSTHVPSPRSFSCETTVHTRNLHYCVTLISSSSSGWNLLKRFFVGWYTNATQTCSVSAGCVRARWLYRLSPVSNILMILMCVGGGTKGCLYVCVGVCARVRKSVCVRGSKGASGLSYFGQKK